MPFRIGKRPLTPPSSVEATPEPSAKRICRRKHDGAEKPTSSSTVDNVFESFPQHTASFRQLKQNLRNREWHHIDLIPREVKELRLNWPTLIPSKKCWTVPSATAQSLESLCEKRSEDRSVIIEEAGQRSETKTLRHVLRDLRLPKDEHPLVAHNISVDGYGVLDDHAVPFPHLRPKQTSSVHFEMNVTPANKIVDIHVDQGTCGLSIAMGQPGDDPTLLVRKIWFLWPPTPHNLKMYGELRQTVSSHGQCLPRSQQLEHGVIAEAGIEAGILLPPGWLHATITTTGGFLGGITFVAPQTVSIVSQMFAIDLRLGMSRDYWDTRVSIYREALQDTKEGELKTKSVTLSIHEAVVGWMGIEQALHDVSFSPNSKFHSQKCRQLLPIWRQFFGGREKEILYLDNCPSCDWRSKAADETFGSHFWKTHMKIIMPQGERTPYSVKKKRKTC